MQTCFQSTQHSCPQSSSCEYLCSPSQTLLREQVSFGIFPLKQITNVFEPQSLERGTVGPSFSYPHSLPSHLFLELNGSRTVFQKQVIVALNHSHPPENTIKSGKMKPSSLISAQCNTSKLHYVTYTSLGRHSYHKILPGAAPSSRSNSTDRSLGTTKSLAFLQQGLRFSKWK